MGSVFQNPKSQFFNLDTDSELAFGLENEGRPPEEIRRRVADTVEALHLQELQRRSIFSLSGGQKQLLAFGSVYAMGPEVFVLDEPTANLDIATRKEIMRTLRDMKEITDTVMIATHDMQLVCEWAERIIVLSGGRVLADGARDEVFGNREVVEQVGIRPPEIFQMGKALDERAFCYTIDEFVQGFERVK